MSDITVAEFKTAIKEALTDSGVTVWEYMPPQMHPPIAIIEPGDPWIADGDTTFAAWDVAWDVYVIAEGGTPEKTAKSMEALLLKAIDTLDAQFAISNVRAPFILQVSEHKSFPASVITVTETTRTLT